MGHVFWGIAPSLSIVDDVAMNEIALAPLRSIATDGTALPGEIMANNADFFSSLSHELRTPLTAIKAMTQGLILHWDELSAEKRYFYVERVLRSSLRLEHLINDLSLAAGLVSGAVLHPVPFDVGAIMAQALDEVRVLHDSCAFSMAPETGPSIVTADPQRILQLLVNLLNIAARQALPGEPVTLRWLTERSVLHVEIDGCGVNAADVALLALRQAPTPSIYQLPRRTVENDLGLLICKTLVEAMGGEIGAHSMTESGSFFWFTVPQASL